MIFLRKVVGKSMEPTLLEGRVIIATTFKTPKVGDVVVAVQNGREVVKRISKITNDWQVTLLGDNQGHSTDSRHHGSIPKRKILGVVVWPKTAR